jgi:hypothetical protein
MTRTTSTTDVSLLPNKHTLPSFHHPLHTRLELILVHSSPSHPPSLQHNHRKAIPSNTSHDNRGAIYHVAICAAPTPPKGSLSRSCHVHELRISDLPVCSPTCDGTALINVRPNQFTAHLLANGEPRRRGRERREGGIEKHSRGLHPTSRPHLTRPAQLPHLRLWPQRPASRSCCMRQRIVRNAAVSSVECRVSSVAMSLLAHPDISAGLSSAASITCLTTAAGLGAVRQIVHGQDCLQAARGCALTPDDLECLQGLLMDGCMQTIHPYSLPAFCGVTAIMVRRHADGRIELAIALDSGRLLASPPSL